MKRLLLILSLAFNAAAADDLSTMGFNVSAHVVKEPSVSRWIQVQRVTPNGPAEKAGVKAGDMIVAIDGVPLRFDTDADALRLLTQRKPGKRVMLTLLRERKERKIAIVPVAMTAEQRAKWVATLRMLDERQR